MTQKPTLSIDVEGEEGLSEAAGVPGDLKHVWVQPSEVEDKLGQTTHGQLASDLSEGKHSITTATINRVLDLI